MSLRIAVCLKVVPKPEEVTFNTETNTLDRTKAENVLNPSDKCALEAALSLKDEHGGTVTIVSMGPPMIQEHLALCLGMGADKALLLSDRAFGGADTFPTSLTLARGIEDDGDYDVVLCGDESADAATGQVPQGIAEWLGMPQITFADHVEYKGGRIIARRQLPGGWELVASPTPVLVSVVVGSNRPRFPFFERVKQAVDGEEIIIRTAKDLRFEPEEVGLPGSHTTVDALIEGESTERQRKFVEGSTQDKAEAIVAALKPFL